jgi:uncharacterized coiled-coil protein SlyX
MKTHIILICAALLALTPLVHASEQGRIDARIKPVKTQVENHETRIKALESSVKKDSNEQNQKIAGLERQLGEQESKINELVRELNAVKSKLDASSKSIDTLATTAKGARRTGNLALWILLPVAALVLLFVGFFLWPRNRAGQTVASPEPGSRPKCPRCGWEHDPGDTVCKNPSCKVQF